MSANGAQEQPSNGDANGEGGANPSTDLVPVQQGSEVVEGENAEEAKAVDENGDENVNETEANLEYTGDGQVEGMSGALPMTGMAPGFDQMQMMMAMQNGFGNFPMMGSSPAFPHTKSCLN